MQDDKTHGPESCVPDAASARRRLVRGSFAAPVALTLASGSALAAASASCVARQVKLAPVNTEAATAGGTWLKVGVYKLNPRSNTPNGPVLNNSRWVSGTEILAFAKTSKNFIADGQWYCISKQASATVIDGVAEVPVKVGDILSVKPSSRGTGDPTSTPAVAEIMVPSVTVALRFNEFGDIIGIVDVGKDGNVGSAITQSCWSSFSPTP